MSSDKQISLFETQAEYQADGLVECLGMTFANDAERRAYFTEELRKKLQDPEFRKVKGFPSAEDEDILAISDPPYYTACPNPFILDVIEHLGSTYSADTDNFHSEPFAADVSEGKNDPIYNAHSYHTKVPHKAIMRYLLHYTAPGDIVLDGFCGTGMTGVAGAMCADRKQIESLGYSVDAHGLITSANSEASGRMGQRHVIQSDLSPAATFIASNYSAQINIDSFLATAERILTDTESECGWLYRTLHEPKTEMLSQATAALAKEPNQVHALSDMPWATINYTIWSAVYVCPECAGEIVFWNEAIDEDHGKVLAEFPCPTCNSTVTKRTVDRAWDTRFDNTLGAAIRQPKQLQVLINYTYKGKRYNKTLDAFDRAVCEKCDGLSVPYWYPNRPMMSKGEKWGEYWRSGVHSGVTHVHHFYTTRNLFVLSRLWDRIRGKYSTPEGRRLAFAFTAMQRSVSRLASIAFSYYFHGGGGAINAGTKGTLYMSSTIPEVNVFHSLRSRVKSVCFGVPAPKGRSFTETCSTTSLSVPDDSVDYIFTDPPFGGNLIYSELNFLWEAWLAVFTNTSEESVVSTHQNKGLREYQELMTLCFEEYYRSLKPGRWMTVEFHNSKNSVWHAIQEALQHAGFVVADVRTLDKKQGSFKQYTAAGAVKQDLVISAYKPTAQLEKRFLLEAGTEKGVWDFFTDHLKQLPVMVSTDGRAEVVAERQDYLLFDRMVAFHVQRGVAVPISAAECYAGLRQRYPERDGMFFLPEQVSDYDKRRLTVNELQQLALFVSDELSAIKWLKQQLAKKTQTFSELQPQFMREVAGWERHEKALELSELLEQNFLCFDGKDDVPSQIHSYLSTNFHELRNLDKDDPKLIAKAKNRWYVPDPRKEVDLEKIRHRALMREFDEYRQSKGKLKVVRTEALRAGFKECWQRGEYQTIVDMANRVKDDIIQEDPALLMYYDNALMRTGD